MTTEYRCDDPECWCRHSNEEMRKRFEESIERTRKYLEEWEAQERASQLWQTQCSCPGFCYFHTRFR